MRTKEFDATYRIRATISVEFVHWPGDAAAKSGEASVAAGLEPVRDVASLSGSSGKDV